MAAAITSHPTRGAWIEIRATLCTDGTHSCRTPPGVRGLKYIFVGFCCRNCKVAPHPGCVD